MRLLSILAVLLGLGIATAHAAPITIVAAENFYGDVAKQIGGPWVAVTSILVNPDQDPHLFEASPSTAHAAPITIVAAENFYGDVAKQIGGPWVAVTSILVNPDQDPHLFEASPS